MHTLNKRPRNRRACPSHSSTAEPIQKVNIKQHFICTSQTRREVEWFIPHAVYQLQASASRPENAARRAVGLEWRACKGIIIALQAQGGWSTRMNYLINGMPTQREYSNTKMVLDWTLWYFRDGPLVDIGLEDWNAQSRMKTMALVSGVPGVYFLQSSKSGFRLLFACASRIVYL